MFDKDDVQFGGFQASVNSAQKYNVSQQSFSSKKPSAIMTVQNISQQEEQSINSTNIAASIVLAWLVMSTLSIRWILQWDYVDCFYFTVVTFTTVGYGDLTPTTDAQKLFTTAYVLFSVIVIGFCFGLFFSDLTSAEEDRQDQLRAAIISDDSWFDDDAGRRRMAKSHGGEKRCFCFSSAALNPTSPDTRSVTIAIIVLAICIAVGTAIATYEGYSIVDGIYFSIVSASTVGYGDNVPHTAEAKIFDSIFIMFGCSSLAWAATNVACIPLIRRSQKRQAQVLHQFGRDLDEEELKDLASGGQDPTCCTKNEFVIKMLVALQMVQLREVRMCERYFEKLDASNDGKLSVADL